MSDIKIKSKNLNVYYGDKQALFDVNLDLNEKEVTALIGPSGCGKSTFIRCINRMNDVIDICKVEGNIEIDDAGEVVYEDIPLFRPHLKSGEGNFWIYLKFCAKISIYLCIFALGGILVTVFGLLYLYSKLAKHFGKLGVRGDTSDEPTKKNGN